MAIRALAFLGLACLATGCALGPNYVKPEVHIPADWESRIDASGVWPDARWWQGFRSGELDRLIGEATENNLDLNAAYARILQAQAQAKIAGAALLPSLNTSGGFDRNWATRAAARGGTSVVVSSNYQASIGASYQVDLFGANEADRQSALTRLEASRYDLETVAITLYSDVSSTYFQVLSLRDRLRLAGETLRIATDVLAVLERRRAEGLISDLEVSQQRSAVASQRANLVSLQQAERVALDALAVLLGRNPQGFAVDGRSLADLTLPGLAAGLPAGLLQRRPDIRRAEANLRAAGLDTIGARAARFPSLDLSAQRGWQGATLPALFSASGLSYGFGASLAAPLFQGGRLEGGEDAARARFQELMETYRAVILAAFRDTENALSATDTSDRRLELAREALDQAREAFRIVEARFLAGSVDFINVLDAQRTVFQANDAVVQAALDRYTAVVNLYTAVGGGWDGV